MLAELRVFQLLRWFRYSDSVPQEVSLSCLELGIACHGT